MIFGRGFERSATRRRRSAGAGAQARRPGRRGTPRAPSQAPPPSPPTRGPLLGDTRRKQGRLRVAVWAPARRRPRPRQHLFRGQPVGVLLADLNRLPGRLVREQVPGVAAAGADEQPELPLASLAPEGLKHGLPVGAGQPHRFRQRSTPSPAVRPPADNDRWASPSAVIWVQPRTPSVLTTRRTGQVRPARAVRRCHSSSVKPLRRACHPDFVPARQQRR